MTGGPVPDGYADATRFRLQLNLRQSYAERLRTLVAMIEFNERAAASDARLRRILELLRARRDR